MSELFQNVLTASFHGSVVIVAVILLRLCLKKAPKKFLCFLWLLAGVRLLMPFEIKSDLSLQPETSPVVEQRWQQLDAPVNEPDYYFEENQQIHADYVEPGPSEEVRSDAVVTPAAPSQTQTREQPVPQSNTAAAEEDDPFHLNWPAMLPYFWLAVSSCFAIYSIYSYLHLKYQVREAIKIPGGWECEHIDTAFILGFIKPRIYIPMGMSRSNRKHILAHERTHLEKGDHWFKMIGFVALAVHWFNPLVWVAYILLCKDIEMACDERVVQFMDLEERKSYSAALLSCSTNRAHFAACPVAFGEVSVKSRILSVLNYKKPGFWISLLGVIAIVFVAVCLVTSPTEEGGSAAAGETASVEEQEHPEVIQKCYDDLEALFAKEEFYYDASATNEQGSVMWQTGLYKQGGNTMWKYNPSSSPDVTDGRLEYEGEHYAYQSGSWVKTDAPDAEFEAWLNLFRWDLETAELVEEKQTETGYGVVFNAKWEGEDRTVHTATLAYSYNNSGDLQNIRIENPNHPTAGRVYLDVIPVSQMWGEPKPISHFFIEAENTITEGMITSDQLAIQAEFDDWGVYFRVDDDRLSNSGSDIYYSQDENGRGVLRTTSEYWIEKKVNGVWEEVEPISEPRWSEDSIGIAKGTSNWEYIDWTPIYGQLPAGEYRMGKRISCYDDVEKYSKEWNFYSEFAIMKTVDSDSPEALAAVERCYAALDELKGRTHIHYISQMGWLEENWINGGNYLMIRTFGDDDWEEENRGRVDISARWDGIGYSQVREDQEVRGSKIIGMALATLKADRAGWVENFEDDTMFFERDNKAISFPEGIGVISEEEVSFVQTWSNSGSEQVYDAQLTYRFDDEGKLTYMEYKPLYAEESLSYYVEIYDTTAEEIDAKIKPYTENLVIGEFSWEEAKAKYTDEDFNIRENDFVNNDMTTISNPVEAARRALKEYPNLGEYLSLDVYRDEEAGMWKVTIESYVEYQSTYGYRDIYMDDNGVTYLLVYEGPIGWDETRK